MLYIQHFWKASLTGQSIARLNNFKEDLVILSFYAGGEGFIEELLWSEEDTLKRELSNILFSWVIRFYAILKAHQERNSIMALLGQQGQRSDPSQVKQVRLDFWQDSQGSSATVPPSYTWYIAWWAWSCSYSMKRLEVLGEFL